MTLLLLSRDLGCDKITWKLLVNNPINFEIIAIKNFLQILWYQEFPLDFLLSIPLLRLYNHEYQMTHIIRTLEHSVCWPTRVYCRIASWTKKAMTCFGMFVFKDFMPQVSCGRMASYCGEKDNDGEHNFGALCFHLLEYYQLLFNFLSLSLSF